MRCAQVNPESAVPSSQLASHGLSVPYHSVSHAGFVHPGSGEEGSPLQPWPVSTAVSASAVGFDSIAEAYCPATGQPVAAQHSTRVGSPEFSTVGPTTSSRFAICAGVIVMLS